MRAAATTAGRDKVRFQSWPQFSGAPAGYRSGLACAHREDPVCIATGPDASDVLTASAVGPLRWTPLFGDRNAGVGGEGVDKDSVDKDSVGYDSVANAGRVFWFSGEGGRLGRLVLPFAASDRMRPQDRR